MKPALIAAFALTVLTGGAFADERAERVARSWRQWAAGQNISSGQVVVLNRGELLLSASVGDAAGPVDLASLSKAVTGACLARLVDEGVLNWSDRVGDWRSDLAGPLRDARLDDLATHSAGLVPDQTQGWMPALRGEGRPAYDELIDRIAERPLGARSYAYNNENYGVLGAVIAEAAGVPYEEVCAQPGLSVSPTYGRFAAWGGWRGELADYGAFHWRAFANANPAKAPSVPAFGEAVRYGLGTVWRAFGDGWNFWHLGALCFDDGDNFMTYAVLYGDGLGVVTHVQGCPDDDWFGTLDAALIRGAFQ